MQYTYALDHRSVTSATTIEAGAGLSSATQTVDGHGRVLEEIRDHPGSVGGYSVVSHLYNNLGYLTRHEPVIFIGDAGTGKTHLATGLCVAACRQRKRARFITAAGLVNELIEAQHHNLLGRTLQRWAKYDLIVLDEVGYVPFAQVGGELLFQIISERAERATFVITTNLPFSEWTQVLPNARLCKALLDRLTDRAHMIETGAESYHLRRTVNGKKSARN